MNPNVKLSTREVWEIFQLAWYGNVSQQWISRRYGISQSHVSHIKHGEVRQATTLPYSRVPHPVRDYL